MLKRFLQLACLLAVALLPLLAYGQARPPSRDELEHRRSQLQKDIEQATEDLNGIRNNRRQTLGQLRLLQNKITLRNKLIDNINQEINYINSDINSANRDIISLQHDLDTLKAQYGRLVVYAYQNHSAYDFMNFILSANSFNDAIKRFEYLKQYREYRKHQASSIVETQGLLKKKIANLAGIKDKRNETLVTEEKQRGKLEDEKQQKDEVVKSLKGQEKGLSEEINRKKRENRELSVRIAAVIRREIEEARRKAAAEAAAKAKAAAAEEARRKALAAASTAVSHPPAGSESAPAKDNPPATASAAPSKENAPVRSNSVLEATPEAKALSENFEANKGKLPWPVESGFILYHFGLNTLPFGKRLVMDNPGIDIQTKRDANVKASFTGTVTNVNIVGGQYMVIIQHGQYFTVYAHLARVSVQKGERIATGQSIGQVFTSEDTGEGDLYFGVYKNSTAVDPQGWLISR